MKTSELIRHLAEHIEKYGDADVDVAIHVEKDDVYNCYGINGFYSEGNADNFIIYI